MNINNGKQLRPKALSPTPLRDWVQKQHSTKIALMYAVAGASIILSGKSSIPVSSNVAVSYQLLFVLLAGAILGSRAGAIITSIYLCFSVLIPSLLPFYPANVLQGNSGIAYNMGLPVVSWLSGKLVELRKDEHPFHFGAAGVAAVSTFQCLAVVFVGLLGNQDMLISIARNSILTLGPYLAYAVLSALIASYASIWSRDLQK